MWVAYGEHISRTKIESYFPLDRLPAEPSDNPPLTPLYDALITNLPHPVMAYPSLPFPPSTGIFPKASVVEEYLETYASCFHLNEHIRLNTSVVDVSRAADQWQVTLSTGEQLYYDLIIVSNGHYRLPRYPATQGLQRWIDAGKATHSAWYRHPDPTFKRIVVVGAGPSGSDIASETSAVSVVFHSVTEPTSALQRCRIAKYCDDTSTVVFEDGTQETGIDHCYIATGYQIDFPFFSSSLIPIQQPEKYVPMPTVLTNSTSHVYPLARFIWPVQQQTLYPPTTLAFLGLPVRVVPFPLAEAQMSAVLKAFRDPSSFDIDAQRAALVERYERLSGKPLDKMWHKFEGLEQFDYRDSLHSYAGEDQTVPEWAKTMYGKKDLLKRVWQKLVKEGKAERFVRGVGKKDPWLEWIELIETMYDMD